TRSRPPEQAPRRAPWLAGALAGAVAALGVYLATRSPAPAAPKKEELEVTHHGPPTAPVAAAEPSAAPTPSIATLAPTAVPGAPHPEPARPAHNAAAAAPRPTVERRAKFPPDVAEVADVTLSPELSAECAGRSVGVSVVVAEDGSLKTTKVISPV